MLASRTAQRKRVEKELNPCKESVADRGAQIWADVGEMSNFLAVSQPSTWNTSRCWNKWCCTTHRYWDPSRHWPNTHDKLLSCVLLFPEYNISTLRTQWLSQQQSSCTRSNYGMQYGSVSGISAVYRISDEWIMSVAELLTILDQIGPISRNIDDFMWIFQYKCDLWIRICY